MPRGEEVHGEVHSTDATTAVEVPLYDADGQTVTVTSTTRLVVTDVMFVTAVAGDGYVFFDNDDDNALDAGETIIRGTVAANGGIAMSYNGTPRFGKLGGKPHVIHGAAGAVDVLLTGYILRS